MLSLSCFGFSKRSVNSEIDFFFEGWLPSWVKERGKIFEAERSNWWVLCDCGSRVRDCGEKHLLPGRAQVTVLNGVVLASRWAMKFCAWHGCWPNLVRHEVLLADTDAQNIVKLCWCSGALSRTKRGAHEIVVFQERVQQREES